MSYVDQQKFIFKLILTFYLIKPDLLFHMRHDQMWIDFQVAQSRWCIVHFPASSIYYNLE